MVGGKHWYKRAMSSGLFMAMAALMMVACAQKDLTGPDVTDRVIYDAALQALKDANYSRSAHLWAQLDRDFPLSDLAERALILEIFTHYQQKNYEGSITAAERFLSLHPRHAAAGYAAYMRAINYWDRISDVERSIDKVRQALESFQDVARIAPGSRYAHEAAKRIIELRRYSAAYAMLQGRASLKQQLYGPALRHFYQVIDHYQDTPQAIEAHYRLVETYALLHDTAKAKFHAAIVKREGGGTVWLEKAEAWLAQADTGAVTLPAAVTAAPVSSLTKTP